jgi:hypothetical protein
MSGCPVLRAPRGSCRRWGVLGLAVVMLFACDASAAPIPIRAAPVPAKVQAMPQRIDDFESAAAWRPVPADGVEMKLSTDSGVSGRALRIDFKFVKGGGYAVLHRDLAIDLPENYRFTFRLRGECRPNNLEFKLIDSTGANVWWCNRRDFVFPEAWSTEVIKQRHISFAWGPAGGGELRHAAALEFAITAGQGGEGTVWLDDLELTALPPPGGTPPPIRAVATSERAGHSPQMAIDGDPLTSWASGPRDKRPYLELDLGVEREFGGVVLDWEEGLEASAYVIDASYDRAHWRVLRTVAAGNGGRDALRLPEAEGRWLRLRVLNFATLGEVALNELTLMPLEWGETPERFFEWMAKQAPRGSFPRSVGGEQGYWTVVGDAAGDADEGLLGEDGLLEMGKRRASLEPFLFVNGRLVTWADVHSEQRLEGESQMSDGDWPLPRVDWKGAPLELSVTAFAIPDSSKLPAAARPLAGASTRLVARYRVRNPGPRPVAATLFLAVRPFQVNPPAQFLNTAGGVAAVHDIGRRGTTVRINDAYGFACVTPPTSFGATTYDQGGVVGFLRAGKPPRGSHSHDPQGTASAAAGWRLALEPGGETSVSVVVPLHESPAPLPAGAGERAVTAALAAVRADWETHRRGIVITAGSDSAREILVRAAHDSSRGLELRLPFNAATASIWPQLGYILVNRDGAAIQPGSRSYERSWIRDGSLTSSALLRLGHADIVKAFIEWFAPFQYGDGKVPCCVDHRGSDPVPEHDSHGEFIYLVAEYHRYTGDRALAEKMWPHVRAAAAYLDSLRSQRRGPEWQAPDKREFFGLLPPSISHEGYSAKPMHSYWDDLFALRGYKDAVYLAGVLGHDADRARLEKSRDEFAHDLAASVRAAMAVHKIDYVPGCADLGDFDATSTTIALNPVQAGDVLPREAIERTFERYWEFFRDRRDGKKDWEAYTPYELRTVGAFVRLGWRDRAAELLQYLLEGQRPAGWRQWPEVVWKDLRAPHFLGDLPHTWVGSDYVRSVLDMLAYVRESDDALVVGAGVPRSWIEGAGLTVRGLPTPYGPLSYTMRSTGDGVEVAVEGGLKVPQGGVVLAPPVLKPFRSATIDGRAAVPTPGGEVVAHTVPARVVFRP